jgi:cyclophilin family peptidyl-prolyl cis-trans isomerase/HEAT repeat protein
MAAPHARDPRLAALGAADTIVAQPPELDAYRLAIYALTRLKAWDALLPLVTKADGGPISTWWPVAYALGRTDDPRAVPALVALAKLPAGGYSRAFAVRGLAALKRAEAAPVLIAMAEGWRADPQAGVSAVRALGPLGVPDAAPALRKLAAAKDADPNIRLEAVTALGALRDTASFNLMLDLLADPWPAMRAAALRGVQALDPDNFLTVLSGLDADPHVSVRSALADVLTKVEPEAAVARLTLMLADKDARVIPAAVGALATLKAPGLGPTLLKLLGHADVMVRAAAASALGDLKVPSAEGALAKAYRDAAKDGAYNARAAALGALRQYGAAAAMPVLREALADRDWAVRVRAAALIRELEPGADVAAAMRPAPGKPGVEYTRPVLVNPPVSPHVFFETDKGTVEIELYVLDAPQACDSFLRLAREGFFTGVAIHRVVPNFVVQDGDPRGDGEGGPGYSLRDEINQQPYLRGTVGMALEWADTGGSQWFITHSPQPHLDGRYTAFGRVVEGMDVVDKLQQWDVIRRVRTWDGVAMNTR